jgi:acetyl-CoA carboxylase, biotin carboxylase subunit
MFSKVLVANRGEIAVRIIRTLREMGIRSVAVYSDADRASLHVRMADEAAYVGASPSSESYLRIDRIIDAARAHGAEAIHPGYGFLSENAEFAAACKSACIVFVGPSPDAIRKMGSKTAARELARAAGVSVVPGMDHGARHADEARAFARDCGYPVLLKAVAGGGGKGMRRVDRDEDLAAAFRDASSEAERAFADRAVYVEKLIERPRHIEMQLLGDRHGHLIHLGERECSLQRRHQKIMEECPSPLVAAHPEMRQAMGEAAVRIARAAGYSNAGTIEFLVDPRRNFYFLEMNTRLQVEHPVTELVTGLDLVRLQLEIAAGESLRLAQEAVELRGAALECRIYAEDPDNDFFPSPGRITHLDRPSGPGIRLDSGVYPGWTVPLDYDPLLAKLAVWAGTREEARVRMIRALDEYYVAGIKTNLSFFRQLLEDDRIRRAELHTGLVDEFLSRRPKPGHDAELEAIVALVAQVFLLAHGPSSKNRTSRNACGAWRLAGRDELLQ